MVHSKNLLIQQFKTSNNLMSLFIINNSNDNDKKQRQTKRFLSKNSSNIKSALKLRTCAMCLQSKILNRKQTSRNKRSSLSISIGSMCNVCNMCTNIFLMKFIEWNARATIKRSNLLLIRLKFSITLSSTQNFFSLNTLSVFIALCSRQKRERDQNGRVNSTMLL